MSDDGPIVVHPNCSGHGFWYTNGIGFAIQKGIEVGSKFLSLDCPACHHPMIEVVIVNADISENEKWQKNKEKNHG